MPKYKAIITKRDGTRICLDLSCREYHAQKLNYVFSRTLDRAIYMDAAVVACDAVQADAVQADAVQADAVTMRRKSPRQILSHEKNLIRGK